MNALEITNLALSRIGEGAVTELSNKLESALSDAIEKALRSGRFSCAKRAARLKMSSLHNEIGFRNIFELPDGCLRVLSVNDNSFPCRRCGDLLYSDAESVVIEYIKLLSPEELDKECAVLVSALMASRLCINLKSDIKLAKQLESQYESGDIGGEMKVSYIISSDITHSRVMSALQSGYLLCEANGKEESAKILKDIADAFCTEQNFRVSLALERYTWISQLKLNDTRRI